MSGSMDQFSSDINNYLTNKIGVQNTHFENSHGLFDFDHVTTAADMAKITQYAMKNKLFREIFGTKELEWEGQSWRSEEHTSELQSRGHLVCRLLLEKQNKCK